MNANSGDRRRSAQFSLRSILAVVLVLAVLLSGAFTHPVSITLALVGVVFVCTGLFHREKVLLIGLVAGLGYIGIAAVIGLLLTID